jgi:hypothetical protein
MSLCIALEVCALSGCLSFDIQSARRIATVASVSTPAKLEVDRKREKTLLRRARLFVKGPPTPSERTQQSLRRYALHDLYEKDPVAAIGRFEQIVMISPTLEAVHAVAEMASIQGQVDAIQGDLEHAHNWHATSLLYSYQYLFDLCFESERNSYDPEFRSACDLYNRSLEAILRALQSENSLKPGEITTIKSDSAAISVAIYLQGNWRDDEIDHFEFVSDFQVSGLDQIHETYGLGVPLIAVRRDPADPTYADRFIPTKLSFPVTAFLHIRPAHEGTPVAEASHLQASLELYDPLQQTQIRVNERNAVLQSDISTPLAYFLKDPLFNTDVFATMALLNADFAKDFRGLYMLEKYDPNRIPVVMVHGLWSSPVTWLEMFNDLRSHPELQENYQFWFYLYPTGQPFWISASQMREDLANAQANLDPDGTSQAMHEIVLVGHSMGGLLSHLQTLDSDSDFWHLVSDQPLENLKAEPEVRQELQRTLFFQPNTSISRVITIATPHQGSNFANNATRWLSHKLFSLPTHYHNIFTKTVNENPEFFRDPELLTINTSIDSLSKDSPMLPLMLQANRSPRVRYNNIIGQAAPCGLVDKLKGRVDSDGDGVVSLESAHWEIAESEITVPASHSIVHQHPSAILEVQRILELHLRQFEVAYGYTPSNKQNDQIRTVNSEEPTTEVSK